MRAVAVSAGAAPALQARALFTAADLALAGGDKQRTKALAEQGLALYRQVGDQVGIAYCLFLLGMSATYSSEYTQARSPLEESVALLRGLGDMYRLGRSLMALGLVDFAQGELTRACARLEEALALFRDLGNTEGMASLLFQLGLIRFYSQGDALTARVSFEEACTLLREVGHTGGVAVSLIRQAEVALLGQDNHATARSLAEEALGLFKDLSYKGGIAEALFVLAVVEARQGNYPAARGLYKELLTLTGEADDLRSTRLPIPYRIHLRGFIPKNFDDTLNLPFYLEGLAEVVAAQGEGVWAARLWGAAASMREELPSPRSPVFQAGYEQAIAAARGLLGKKAYAAAWAQGRALTLEQVLGQQGRKIIPEEVPGVAPLAAARTQVTYPAGLSTREVEVLRLVAEGLTNEQIAERLVISYRAVTTHLNSIYTKLGVNSRSAATRFAVEHHLV